MEVIKRQRRLGIKIPGVSHTIRFPKMLYDSLLLLQEREGGTFNGLVVQALEIGVVVLNRGQEAEQKAVEEWNAAILNTK